MREFEPVPDQDEALAKKIIGAAIEVYPLTPRPADKLQNPKKLKDGIKRIVR